MIDELLKLVENGIYLFPVKITNKQPLTAHGFKDASNDAEQIKNWFGGDKLQTVGVAINLEKSGLVCIDVDNNHGGDNTNGTHELSELTKMHPDLHPTNAEYIEATQSSGIHMIYKRPQQELHKKKLSSSIEVLVDSVVIAPTSNYKAIKGNIWDVKNYLPNWIFNGTEAGFSIPKGTKIFYGKKTRLAKGLELLIYPEAAGNRHNALISFIGALFYAGTDIEVIKYLVYEAADRMNFPETEVDNMMSWAISRAAKQLKRTKGE